MHAYPLWLLVILQSRLRSENVIITQYIYLDIKHKHLLRIVIGWSSGGIVTEKT